MTQVNLLPTGVREKQKTRRVTVAAVVGVAGVMMILLLVYVLQVGRLASASRQLTAQESINRDYRSKIQALQPFADLKTNVANRQALVAQLMHGEILWSGVLHDLSMVLPDQMWLTGMTGTLNTSGAAGSGAASAGLAGNIQFQGYSFDHPTVALWLVRLQEVHGWVNAWISNAARTDFNNHSLVQFVSSVDLTTDATTNGGRK
ncbi:MAG TPA: PilN domain-containing protein [Acidimicrobiia bacterium]|nr:PilN domain-containing protein [Acidimicrobiia bacterium]